MSTVSNTTSSYVTNNFSKDVILQQMTNLTEVSQAISAGGVYSSFADVFETSQVSSLLSDTSDYIVVNGRHPQLKEQLTELQYIESIVKSMVDTLNDATLWLQTAADPSIGDRVDVMSSAKSSLGKMQDLLNSSFRGVYLFSGNKTNTPAVSGIIPPDEGSVNFAQNATAFIANKSVTLDNNYNVISFDASYYNGDSNYRNYTITDTSEFLVNIAAGDAPFQEIIGALELAWYASYQESSTLTTQCLSAISYISDARDQISSFLSSLGNMESIVLNQIESDAEELVLIDTRLQTSMAQDEAALIIQLSDYTMMLQAAIRINSVIQDPSMQVANYIKI
jgi:hypothetical protein